MPYSKEHGGVNHQTWRGNVGFNSQLQGVVNGLVDTGVSHKLLVWDLNAEHDDRPDDFGVPYTYIHIYILYIYSIECVEKTCVYFDRTWISTGRLQVKQA